MGDTNSGSQSTTQTQATTASPPAESSTPPPPPPPPSSATSASQAPSAPPPAVPTTNNKSPSSPSPITTTSTRSSTSSTAPSSSSARSSTVVTSNVTSNTTTTVLGKPTTTASVPPVALPTTSASPSLSTSIVVTSEANGQLVTSTTITTSTPPVLSPASASPSGSDSDKGFFQNTGAVAGTFTAVGVVGLALLIFLVTFIIRRRRQAKFDREVNEATLEAANTSAPPFLDTHDGYDGYDGPGGVYSDASSHGTFAQPPMSTDAYGMREIGHGVGIGMTPGYAHGYDYDAYPPAAAYAHPQQAQVYADYAQAHSYPQDTAYNNSHSNLYAAPSQGHGQEGQPYYRPQAASPEHQLLEAAGLDPSPAPGPGAGTVQRGMSLNHNPSDERDAYGGYAGHSYDHDHAGDDRGSYYEEVERPRVLKIANA